jgi:hypothetical protein
MFPERTLSNFDNVSIDIFCHFWENQNIKELLSRIDCKNYIIDSIEKSKNRNELIDYKIKFNFKGRDCIILPYTSPSHPSQNKLTPYANWSTVFKLKVNKNPKDEFFLQYKGGYSFFYFLFQKKYFNFDESNINIIFDISKHFNKNNYRL